VFEFLFKPLLAAFLVFVFVEKAHFSKIFELVFNLL
jgi:hypothetical protein